MKMLIFLIPLLFLLGPGTPGSVQAQHVLHDCLDFTPSTCPSKVKDRFLLQLDEYNKKLGLYGTPDALTPMEFMWEALRHLNKKIAVEKKRAELKNIMNAQLQATSDEIDEDMPTAIPHCGDGIVNRNEDCDGADDSACPGLCAGDCQCLPPTTTTTLP